MAAPNCDREKLICPYSQYASESIELLRFALATVLGDAVHGQNLSWGASRRIGREVLSVTAPKE